MKKLLIFGIFVSCSTFVRAWNPPDASLTMTTDSRQLNVSTTPASPTRLLTRDSQIQRNLIVNLSTCSIFIGTSTTISFSTSFSINPSSGNFFSDFSPDGVNSPWGGELYGLSNCIGVAAPAKIFRSK